MYLADTSVWIDHFRNSDPVLAENLAADLVACHPHVIGELALGSIKSRELVLTHLSRLPQVHAARDNEVLHLINQKQLFSRGIGYVDAHLLAATLIHGNLKLWTKDTRLAGLARELDISAVD